MTDYRTRLEDATDCSGAAREDDELVLVTVGDIRAALSEGERMREALERINRRASPSPDRTFDVTIRDLEWVTAEARQALGDPDQ